ncbi:DinB family protein [Flavobacterium gelidilacus]|uniref:DinB family protein n=1 Tax=Flavobacterium gelidilacus TaxID=206041 RepID=UPI0004291C5F|nr:DinB family protein [Flavobacterium gelidilacus]
MLIASIKENFNEIISLLSSLESQQYTVCHQELSNATIGEHTRHIIEMYQSLLKNYENGNVNYDKRDRNLSIQTDIEYAINCINEILSEIEKPNKELFLEQGIERIKYSISTNYERELLYNLEHSIHHQALIKVAVLKHPSIQLSENFGVAKSTIEYRNQCVQ